MARKNRISVPDGTYHIATRIAHGAMLLKEDGVKERSFSRRQGAEIPTQRLRTCA